MKPDPGRVSARRLNRNEYSNTIRDLLAVEFRAQSEFPTDDSAGGFDNMSEVLTVSPVLMEKYLDAAERIAARAIGAEPLPKPIEVESHPALQDGPAARFERVEATHRVELDADYRFRSACRASAQRAAPVTLGLWMDGKLLHSMPVETKPSGLVYFNPYSEEQIQGLSAGRRPRFPGRLHRRRFRKRLV